MKDIEFRAWLKKYLKVVDVTRIDFEAQEITYQEIDFEYDDVIREKTALFKDISLLRYTGRKDKNGVKIFEGDIVKLPAYLCYNTEYAICKWIDNRFAVEIGFGEDTIGFGFVDLKGKGVRSDEWDDFKVIGNVFENRGLLNEN